MSGAISLFPQYTFMAWYSVKKKHRDNFTFTLLSDTFNLCSSLTVKNQVSHPYKMTGKIMVLHILISVFKDEMER
jgi:hypothetical protein